MDVNGSHHLVIGAFQPFGGKYTNQADEVAKRLSAMREAGELEVPDDVKVTVVPIDTNAASVESFVRTARELHADKVLMLGENGLGLRVETRAHDRGKPLPLMLSAVSSLLPHSKKRETLESRAPTQDMAQAANATVSRDTGHFYCNYSYHSALRAGLNAVFVHVPSGIFGLGRNPDAAAKSVNKMLGTWYQKDVNGPLVMLD